MASSTPRKKPFKRLAKLDPPPQPDPVELSVEGMLELMSLYEGNGLRVVDGRNYYQWLVDAGRAASGRMRWAWATGHEPEQYRDLMKEPKVPPKLRKHFEANPE